MKLFYAVAFLRFSETSVPLVSGMIVKNEGSIKSESRPRYSFLHNAVQRVLQNEECCQDDDEIDSGNDDNSSNELQDDDELVDDSGNNNEATEDITHVPSLSTSLSPSPFPTSISREENLENVMPTIYTGLAVPASLWTKTNYCEWEGIDSCNGIEPTEIDLRFFSDTYSPLYGTLPTELGLLTDLEVFQMDYNYFITGTIPTEFGLLTDLGLLRLRKNDLSGSIPSQLENMSSLTSFVIYDNHDMIGTVPASLCDIYIDIGNTGITNTCV